MFIKDERSKIQSRDKPKKFWLVWKVRHGDITQPYPVKDALWLAKEDYPGFIRGTYEEALKTADEMSSHSVDNATYVVLEAVAMVQYKLPVPAYKSDVKLLTAH